MQLSRNFIGAKAIASNSSNPLPIIVCKIACMMVTLADLHSSTKPGGHQQPEFTPR